MEKLDRGEQSGLHRLLEVDSAKQQVLQGLAVTVDRVDQLVVQRLAEHLAQGAEGDESKGLELWVILAIHLGDPHILVLGGSLNSLVIDLSPAALVTRLRR